MMARADLRARLSVFRPLEDRDRAERYQQAHLEVLRHYDMVRITSAAREWLDNPNVHALLLEDEGGTPLAGVRLHIADGRYALPTERAYTDGPEVGAFVRERLAAGVGEACGGWVSRPLAKQGLLHFMTCAALSIAGRLGLCSVLGSCAGYTLPTFQQVGFVVETSLGKEGTFDYVAAARASYFIVVRDPTTLADAAQPYREVTADLRRRPMQRRVFASGQASLLIDVNVGLPAVMPTISAEMRAL